MKTKCKRCHQERKIMSTSYLNGETICVFCKEEEMQHPLYRYAKEVEFEEVQKGNYSYPGFFSGKSWEEIKQIQKA